MNVLDQPLVLPNGAIIPNRLAKSAMSEALATYDNRVTEYLPRLYARWSAGGTGLLITGNVMIDRRALGEPNNVVLEDERDLVLLERWANAASSHGSVCWVQLNHPGKQAPKGLNKETVAPSALGFDDHLQRFFQVPRALTEAEIASIIDRFAQAALLVKKAGFAGVQIHGAHGYLVSQFLSPKHNQRQDRYGGNAENRRRFVLDVYHAMRRAVGPEFPIGIKLNSADFQKGGFAESESIEVIQALAQAGIDLFEISGGTYETPVMSVGTEKESSRRREAYFLEFAEKVRAVVSTPLMVTGGFRTRAGMEEALNQGALDLIGLARPLALDPDYSRIIREDRQPAHLPPVRVRTGIPLVDRLALMEVAWYTRQLHRLAHGKKARPEHPLLAFGAIAFGSGWKTWNTRRMRA